MSKLQMLIANEIEYRVAEEYKKYHNKLTFKWNGEDFWIKQIVWKLGETFLAVLIDQRAKDLKKLSFHTGIPVEVLEGYLRSKD